MGRGNVCVNGDYEGLWYVDNDYINWYHKKGDTYEYDDYDEYHKLQKDLTSDEFSSDTWSFDWLHTDAELDWLLGTFEDRFMQRFSSFEYCDENADHHTLWWRNGGRAVLENELFWIVVQDNEWSIAIELIQKEDDYDNHLLGLQKRHYERYLNAMAEILLELVPDIYAYSGAWTSRKVTAESFRKGVGCA
jgi:hypothetical protein